VRYARLLSLIIILCVVGVVAVGYSAVTNYSNTPATTIAIDHTVTETCYLDGCIPIACPSWGCGPVTITTTISSNIHSTQENQTFAGTVKIIPGTGAGVYFFDVGSLQYHLVFCKCAGTAPCNCPNIPTLKDGQRIQVTGTVTTPSTYGSVWAPGGDIYVQTWTAL